MVDLDELERLYKVAQGSLILENAESFIFAISRACDNGLLQRLRTAEEQGARSRQCVEDQLSIIAECGREARRERNRLEAAAEDLRIAEASLAALKAENESLREALVAMRTVMDTGPSPRKLDEALSWRECDEKARALCDAALETTND